MRRARMVVLLSTVASVLVLSVEPASAQTPERVARIEATVFGHTDPDPNEHQLGVNRVSGESEFVATQIDGELECDDGEIVKFSLAGPPMRFRSDDDVTDGFGEIDGTMAGFRDDAATAVRPGGLPQAAQVEVRVLGGRIHRILVYGDAELRLDIRVFQDNVEVCEDPEHEVRLAFLITGPAPDGEGMSVTGRIRTHELPTDGTTLAREACQNVPGAMHAMLRVVDDALQSRDINTLEPVGIRVSISEDHRSVDITAPVRTGRGPFQPCKPPTE
jgi:hypothetical protein